LPAWVRPDILCLKFNFNLQINRNLCGFFQPASLCQLSVALLPLRCVRYIFHFSFFLSFCFHHFSISLFCSFFLIFVFFISVISRIFKVLHLTLFLFSTVFYFILLLKHFSSF